MATGIKSLYLIKLMGRQRKEGYGDKNRPFDCRFRTNFSNTSPCHGQRTGVDGDIKCEVSRDEYDPDRDSLVLFTQWRLIL